MELISTKIKLPIKDQKRHYIIENEHKSTRNNEEKFTKNKYFRKNKNIGTQCIYSL